MPFMPPYLRYVLRTVCLVIMRPWLIGTLPGVVTANDSQSFTGTMTFVPNLDGNWDLFLLEDCNGQ